MKFKLISINFPKTKTNKIISKQLQNYWKFKNSNAHIFCSKNTSCQVWQNPQLNEAIENFAHLCMHSIHRIEMKTFAPQCRMPILLYLIRRCRQVNLRFLCLNYEIFPLMMHCLHPRGLLNYHRRACLLFW